MFTEQHKEYSEQERKRKKVSILEGIKIEKASVDDIFFCWVYWNFSALINLVMKII